MMEATTKRLPQFGHLRLFFRQRERIPRHLAKESVAVKSV